MAHVRKLFALISCHSSQRPDLYMYVHTHTHTHTHTIERDRNMALKAQVEDLFWKKTTGIEKTI